MPRDKKGLDRRDFMIAAAASVGATTAIAASSAPAGAQDNAATLSGDQQGTVFTGDVVQGKKVIRSLDVNDLEPGRHNFHFEGVQSPGGYDWYVAVSVVKGAKPGKRVALISGVHGDEMSSIHTVQTVVNQLDPQQMAGTVVAVYDVSRPALEGMARRWPNSGRGVELIDMNREWPGHPQAPSAPSRHADALFSRVLRPNADYALDYHTGATGMDIVAFHLARMELPEVKAMAELFPIGKIFDNPAYPTLLANAFIDAGIPALTPEIGAARILDSELIPLFVEGTLNVLKHHGILSGPIGRTGRDSNITAYNSMHGIIATHGGFVELLVKLDEQVEVGHKLAVQRNAFGEVVAEYASDVAGVVSGFRNDVTAEPGTPLVFLLYNKATPEEPDDFAE